MGIGLGCRATRMIEVAHRHAPARAVRYVGIDLFEARSHSDPPGLSLKSAHQILRATGARIQLLPGDPLAALSRTANSLRGIELVVIASGWDPQLLTRAWFYFPRMLAPQSQFYVEESIPSGEGVRLRRVAPTEIIRLAEATLLRRAA